MQQTCMRECCKHCVCECKVASCRHRPNEDTVENPVGRLHTLCLALTDQGTNAKAGVSQATMHTQHTACYHRARYHDSHPQSGLDHRDFTLEVAGMHIRQAGMWGAVLLLQVRLTLRGLTSARPWPPFRGSSTRASLSRLGVLEKGSQDCPLLGFPVPAPHGSTSCIELRTYGPL